MIKVYQKQPITFEQFDGSSEMIDKYDIESTTMCMPTKHSYMRVCKKDWIATGANSEHWVIDDDIFQDNYAELPVIPAVIAEYISAVKNGETDLENITVVEAALGAIEYDQASHIEDEWIQQHGDEFARAWLDGYQVEADR